jgi:hypothetical protein
MSRLSVVVELMFFLNESLATIRCIIFLGLCGLTLFVSKFN